MVEALAGLAGLAVLVLFAYLRTHPVPSSMTTGLRATWPSGAAVVSPMVASPLMRPL